MKKGFENHWKPNGQPKAISLIEKASLNKMHSTIFFTSFKTYICALNVKEVDVMEE